MNNIMELILEKVEGEKVGEYSDDTIRRCEKITLKIAVDYMGLLL